MGKILYIAKWIAGVIGGITAIAGIVSFIYTLGVKQEKKNTKESYIEVKIDKLIESDSVKTIKIEQILKNQGDLFVEQVDMNSKIDKLNRSYVNHLKNDNKIDQLIQYLDNEKKNEGTSLLMTRPKQNNTSTPSN